MKRIVLSLLLCLLPFAGQAVTKETTTATGAVLRGLDRQSEALVDITLNASDVAQFGALQITLKECRFPTNNPSGDAFVHLVISEGEAEKFRGWMVASSPALNPLEHARYDVWVLRCNNS
ncbi:MAG: DUF2155 domain-containing protein [Halocynthiibacter sp.]